MKDSMRSRLEQLARRLHEVDAMLAEPVADDAEAGHAGRGHGPAGGVTHSPPVAEPGDLPGGAARASRHARSR